MNQFLKIDNINPHVLVPVSITWRNKTCYTSHQQAAVKIFKKKMKFVRKDLYFSKINISLNRKEKNLEIFTLN